MPTTRLKNTLYRFLLPFCAPGCGMHPVSGLSGHRIIYLRTFSRLIRRHHVLGSASLLSSGNHSALLFTSSSNPCHTAFPETYFRVASITKIATAILVMRLADLGYLSPEDDAGSFFSDKDAQSALSGISLFHLLSHTSGLVDPPDLESRLENGVPFTCLFPAVRHDSPGRSFHYSNLGFGIVGSILESVLDKPLGEIYRQHLFGPLQMNATLEGCTLPPDRIMPVSRVLPWHKEKDLILTPLGSHPLRCPDPLRHYGHSAGSMYTDIRSLEKLLHVLTDDSSGFLSFHSGSLMKRTFSSYGSLSPTLSYGLGLLRIDDPFISDSPVYGHQGFAYGCADGAFWEESTGRILIFLNGGCSEARNGRLGTANRDFLRWAFRKELPSW